MQTASPPPARGTADPQEPDPDHQVSGSPGASVRLAPVPDWERPPVQNIPEASCDLETVLPRPGAKLTLLRSYPDGVMAILDQKNGRVMFCRLQEMFESNMDWQPVKYPGRSETL